MVERESLFGWCSTNHHKDCIKRYRRFYIGKKKVGRRSVEGVIFLDEEAVCNCPCHRRESVVDSSKTKPKRRRKK